MISGVLRWSIESVFGVSLWGKGGSQNAENIIFWCLKDWLFCSFIEAEETASIDKYVQGVFKSLIRLRNRIFRRFVSCKRQYRLLSLQLGMNNHESYQCVYGVLLSSQLLTYCRL
jgi:hypothetical protein